MPHVANFWYEVTLRDSKRDALRRLLFSEQHPVEKLQRIALGPLTLEGLPQGRYRLLDEKEVSALQRMLTAKPRTRGQGKAKSSHRGQEKPEHKGHREEPVQ